MSRGALKGLVWIGALAAMGLVTCGAIHKRAELRRVVAKLAGPPHADPPAKTGELRLTIDPSKKHAISRFVYGLNSRIGRQWGANDTARTTLDRFGGNRLTAYDFRTNDSNCGNDCKGFNNDEWLAYGLPHPHDPAAAVTERIDASRAKGKAGFIVTVPIEGWVAADHAGPTPVPVAPSQDEPATPGPHFVRSEPRRPAGAPDSAHAGGTLYQDDFVRLLAQRYPGAVSDPERPILFTLDNEPDLWGGTHAELRGHTSKGEEVLTGFDELVSDTVSYSAAIKDAWPGAQVLAPGLSGWFGFYSLGHKSGPPEGYTWFIDYFLDRVQKASTAQGRRLVDVLDLHWYPEAHNTCHEGEKPCWSDRITDDWQPQTRSVIEARVQAPRSLWDPTYTEHSWVADKLAGPITLLPRLRDSIARHAPGTKLAVTEYYYGRGGDISGAIAEADVLGIFGREGIFAATLWPNAAVYAWNKPAGTCDGDYTCATHAYACVFSALRAYLDYDGAGARFGDVGVEATASDPARASVYASVDPAHPERLVVVAINKLEEPQKARLDVRPPAAPTAADVYRVTGGVGHCEGPVKAGTLALARGGTVIDLPPLSISVLVLR